MRSKPFTTIFSSVKEWIARLRLAYEHYCISSNGAVRGIGMGIFILSCLSAISCLISLTLYYGFEHTLQEYSILKKIVLGSQCVFLINIIFTELFPHKGSMRLSNRFIHLLVEIPVLITFIPLIYPRPLHPWIPLLEHIVYSNIFLFASLAVYSVVVVSLGIMRLINQRTNPSMMLSISFLILIFIGSFLLSLPKCNNYPISYIDALFVSTSAVCITGLTSVDVSTQFTPLGFFVLGMLIQTGALGLMTFTYLFAMFFSGNSTIFSQLMLKDVVYTRSLSALLPTLFYILSFTVVIEIIGALAIWWSVHDTLGLTGSEYFTFCVFHSVSSFCNAGFSTMDGGLSNPALLIGNQSIYWITTMLVIAGGIGFPILVNFKDAIFGWVKNHFTSDNVRQVHLYNMNTKIVLTFYFTLLLVGAVLFFLFEFNNSLHGLSLSEKVTQSVFNSSVPRSSGFSSLNPAGFLNVTLLVIMFLMWVGGASQSTAGGIKVNTLAAIYYNLRSIITGSTQVNAFNRRIAVGSIRRANAVVALSIFSYTLLSVIIIWLEPQLPARSVLFETLSALFTVGSSLGITSQLSDASLVVICMAMFIGRVGVISLLTGLVRIHKPSGVSYPEDDIIIS